MPKALTKFFAPKSKEQAVSAHFLGEAYFIATEYGSDRSDPCYVVGPVIHVARPADPAELGNAASRGLDQCRYDFDAPKNREHWKTVKFPLLEATRLKTWAAVAKHSNSLTVRRLGAVVTVLPCYREKQGFHPLMDRLVSLDAPERSGARAASYGGA